MPFLMGCAPGPPSPACCQQGHSSLLHPMEILKWEKLSQNLPKCDSHIHFLDITVSVELKQLDTAVTINLLIQKTKVCAGDRVGIPGRAGAGRGQSGSMGTAPRPSPVSFQDSPALLLDRIATPPQGQLAPSRGTGDRSACTTTFLVVKLSSACT